MADPVRALVTVLVILQLKHFLCDYPLQTLYQVRNKGTYLHPAGILHSGLHALLTMTAFLVVPPSFLLGCAIVIGEFLVHYHIDWAKEQVLRRNGWTSADTPFWWALGTDQMLHYFTYLLIATLLVMNAS